LNIYLFIPCYVDQLFPEVGSATVNILRDLDCHLVYPEAQTCCGQPAFNSGYYDEAAELALRFIDIFKSADYIVAPSGSCVTMAKNLYGELPLPEKSRGEWIQLSKKIYELSDFLISVLNIETWEGYFPAKITYHDSCHALRELQIAKQPRQLLRSIEGLEFIEMSQSDTCCGFGGTFAVKFPGISTAMVRDKNNWIQESGAEIVVSTDSSCLMNIDGYAKKQKLPVKSMHIAQVLWQSRENLVNK